MNNAARQRTVRERLLASWAPVGRGQPHLMNNVARQRAAGRGVAVAPALEPGRGGRGSDGRKMAALKEARSYGLSCGRVSDGSKVSVFHVKLTDSALKAFESYRASQVSGVGSGAPSGTSGRGPASRAPHRGALAGSAGSSVLLVGPWASGVLGRHQPGAPGTAVFVGATRRYRRTVRGGQGAGTWPGGASVLAPGGVRGLSWPARHLGRNWSAHLVGKGRGRCSSGLVWWWGLGLLCLDTWRGSWVGVTGVSSWEAAFSCPRQGGSGGAADWPPVGACSI